MQFERKEKFTLRKSKKYKNLVSLAFGVVAVTAIGLSADKDVHASETDVKVETTQNPATNAPTVQPVATVESTTSLENTGKATGEVTVEVNKVAIETAITEAKEAGVKVKKEDDVNKGTATSIEETRKIEDIVKNDYNKQAEEIKEVTKNYVKEVSEHKTEVNKIVEENTKLQANYEKKVVKYNNELQVTNRFNEDIQKKYDKELNIYNQTVSNINKENADAKEQYERAYQTYLINVTKIKEENTKTKVEYENKLQQYEANKTKIEEENNKTKSTYDKAKSNLETNNAKIIETNKVIEEENNKTKSTYDKKMEIYNKDKKSYDSELKKIRDTKSEFNSKSGITVYGDYNTNAKGGYDYYKNFIVVGSESLGEIEKLKDYVGWHTDTVVEKLKGNYTLTPKAEQQNWYNLYDLSLGDTYIIKNIATLSGGKKVHLEVTPTNLDIKGKIINGIPKTTPYISLGKPTGSTGIGFDYLNYLTPSQNFKFVDETGKEVRLLLSTVVTDVDWGQGSKLLYDGKPGITLNPTESGLTDKLGDGSLHSKKGSPGVSDVESIPEGSFASVGVGSIINYTHYSDFPNPDWENAHASGNYQDIAFQLFGESSTIPTIVPPYAPQPPVLKQTTPLQIGTIPNPEYKPLPEKPIQTKPKELPNAPTEPNYKPLPEAPKKGEFKVTPPAPEEPRYKEIPKAPQVPTVKYHYNVINVQPSVYKEVKNTEGINIDNGLVSKLSTVNWELKTEILPVNRDIITSFVITDSFPSGFELNLENTKKLSKGFTVEFNKKTNTAVFTATSDILATLNMDLTKEVTPVYPIASGTVLNDGATYVNNFRLDVTTKPAKSGNVIVHYVDTKGNTIAKDVEDTKDGKVGTLFDTTDNKPKQIAFNGDLYTITSIVKGNEKGEVVVGNQEVTYVYDKVSPKEDTGMVIVHYVDTKGNTIKHDVTDTPESKTGTDYDTTDNKPKEITKDKVAYKITNTVKGKETGKVVNGVTEVTYVYERITPEPKKDGYTKYSNKVKVHTPGKPNDPENPNNNLIKPEKHNENKDGAVIDGKTLLPKTENYYKLLWDLDQYQDIKVSKEDIAKGFFYVDDYPEEALELNTNGITLVDSKGQEVKGVKVESFENLEKATSEVKSTLEKAGIKPKGAFQLFIAENPEEFFNDYVVTGNSIMITSPMVVKEGFTGEYENKAYQIDFGNGYETDIVTNNVTKPEPKKANTNKEGVNIDGKTLLAGSVNYYKLTWDLDQYKDIKVNKEDISKGFFYVDDYPEEALKLNEDGVTLVDSKGQEVKGVKVESFESLEKATSEVKSTLEKTGINPKGAFQLFIAENPEQFFKDYVVTGNSITITSPMTVKEAFSGEYENKAYQVDFGMGYETEVVANNVPKITPEKDVVIDVMDKNSLDGKTIELNTVFNYHLVGGKLPANRGVEITQYGFSDDYDETGDKYDGNYKVFATVDITLKDGTVIKRDTEITEHTTQTHENGKVEIELNKDFLEKISNDSEFQADVYLQMTRVQAGEFENTFENTINGVKTISNTVKTKTPEKPIEPQTPEQPSEPEEPQKTLPNTGLNNNGMTTVGLGLLMSAALLVARKKQKQK